MSVMCWILRRHDWSPWLADGLRTALDHVATQTRYCGRCWRIEHRPLARPTVELDGEQVTLPPPLPIPVHEAPEVREVTDYTADNAGIWFDNISHAETGGEPVARAQWVEQLMQMGFARPIPVTPRARVINRDQLAPEPGSPLVDDVMGAAVHQIGDSLTAMAAAGDPEKDRQLAATREMLTDIGRQLDEVTSERDRLKREQNMLPPSVVGLQHELGITKHQLEEITRDRDTLSDVSGRRLEQIRALVSRLAVARTLVLSCAPNSDVLAALALPEQIGEGWTDDHPVGVRPDRC